ncbi:RNA polymerase sigma factor [Chitinophaga nivalis]|uniref:RNA polymerase sigma-70 factor n=1 Tax=Chitinophaga nivalis TaxID=2991709 RepID=A0ABT3IIB3_9BACT|nr:RNA polymerase sigma-70 factor [Chitinophaga nivalis]MCW3466618.1 RNA polymerase sigma-70 factor [Chitinophaga nivalis]MCW3483691.1 RNA polymerase sigma-70 factor [Chitinophaga nivalis]
MHPTTYTSQLDELHDEALLEEFRQGNAMAFEELYKRFWGVLYLQAYRILVQEDDAKDVVQEVFITFWSKAATIEISGSVAAYLYVATRNRVLNLLASKRTYQTHLSSLKHFLADTHNNSLQYITEKEITARMEQEIHALPAKMREVFELSRKTALTHKEIASKLQLSQETVKKQISNAIRTLRHKMAHFSFFL